MSILIAWSLLMTTLLGPDKYKGPAFFLMLPALWYVMYAYKSFGILR